MLTALILWVCCLHRAEASQARLEPATGKIAYQCKGAQGAPHVWLFKQWHAEAALDTHDRVKARQLPQAANQAAIFRQLDRWVTEGTIGALVAEGCEGELTQASRLKINGWSIDELRTESTRPHYDDEIVTSVAEKLEAKHGSRVQVLCGDTDALIREQLLAASDIRGTFGYLSRLIEYRGDPQRSRPYLEDVIKLFKLPAGTGADRAIALLKEELKKGIERFNAVLEKRNEHVVRVLRSAAGKGAVAVVYGGAHAPGLIKLLEAKGLGCTVVEPAGYDNDEAELISRLERALKSL